MLSDESVPSKSQVGATIGFSSIIFCDSSNKGMKIDIILYLYTKKTDAMKTFSEVVNRRRSCRKFEVRKVTREVIDLLLKEALTAPSARNTRSTRFAVTEDPATLEKLSRMRNYGSLFLKDAPVVVAILGETSHTDLWRENGAISATILQLSAEAHGLGSCWVHVHDRLRNNDDPDGPRAEDYAREILKVPDHLAILCLIALGYPADPPQPRREQDDTDKITYL